LRGRQCPTVEAWQSRLLPRIRPEDRQAFERVRGRVAAAYAYTKILGGDRKGARRIVADYGREMPKSKVRTLLRAGAALGAVGWSIGCAIVRLRELLKSARLARQAARRG
jgi:hypothetical protein